VNVPVWLPVLLMVVGVLLILRSTVVVATKGEGRFRADPLVTMMVGFALVLLAQYLLR
jgi:cell division protein FtsW (lipid II flippase)